MNKKSLTTNLFLSLAFISTLLIPSTLLANDDKDPLERFNRAIYKFNDVADRYFLKPIAKVYQKVTPQFVDNGISHFFINLTEPLSAVNALLQGKVINSGREVGRFVINSTIGVVGFMDVATKMGIESQPEDFGQTLAVWGVGSGPYLMLPFLGPSNFRDAGGKVVDTYSSPLTYIEDVRTRNTLKGMEIIDIRADLLSAESLISGDRYVFIRDAYLQRRDYLIHDGDIEDDFGFDDFDDFGDEE